MTDETETPVNFERQSPQWSPLESVPRVIEPMRCDKTLYQIYVSLAKRTIVELRRRRRPR